MSIYKATVVLEFEAEDLKDAIAVVDCMMDELMHNHDDSGTGEHWLLAYQIAGATRAGE